MKKKQSKMKTYFFPIILSVILVFASCSEDEDNKILFANNFGIIHITNDSIIITTDNKERLLVTNNNLPSTLKDKDRITFSYFLVEKTIPKGIDQVIDINEAFKIQIKSIIKLTDSNKDSLKNDEFKVYNVWASPKYLTLCYGYYGGQNKHIFDVVRKLGETRTDTINLEIKHNKNTDFGSTEYFGYISFDISPFENDAADSVILVIKAIEYDYRSYSRTLTYKY